MKTTVFAFLISLCMLFGGCTESDAPAAAKLQLEMKASTTISKIKKSYLKQFLIVLFIEFMIDLWK